MGQLVDEEHPVVRLVDRPGDDAFVGKGPELRVTAVPVPWRTSPRSSVSLAPVAITNDVRSSFTSTFRGLCFWSARRCFEGPLVEDLDAVAGPFVGHDLLHPVLETGRADGFLRVPARVHGELE